MSFSSRHQAILDLLRSTGGAEVEDLSQRFSVSPQTIRNDLRELEMRGKLSRTHGGARLVHSASGRSYEDRRLHRHEEKRRMGQLAATLIPENCSVALNIGTSTEQVARALIGHHGLVVLSNNINIINILLGTPGKDLRLIGGAVRPEDGAIVGEDAVEHISRYKTDFAVIGASALDEDGAVLDHDAQEVAVARAILRNARTRILVCDSSKFNCTAPVRISEIGDLDYVITDKEPPAGFVAAAHQGNTKIMTLETAHGKRAQYA